MKTTTQKTKRVYAVISEHRREKLDQWREYKGHSVKTWVERSIDALKLPKTKPKGK